MHLPKKFRTGYLAPPVVIILAIITLAVAATIAAQAIFFKKEPTPKPVAQASTKPKTSPSPPTTSTIDETANWKTYKNERYGFEVKHPSNWMETENDTQISFFTNELRFEINPQPQGRGTYFTQTKLSEILVGGLKSQRTDYLSDSKEIFFSIINLINKEGHGWNSGNIILDASKSNSLKISTTVQESGYQPISGSVTDFDLLDQVLSTFKFIE